MPYPNYSYTSTVTNANSTSAPYNSNSFTPNSINGINQNPLMNVVTVKGEQGAMMYPVAAGNTMLLIDFESNQFWLKSTAQNGMPMQLRSFSFSEVTPKDTDTNFVTKKELDDLKSYLDSQFQGLKGQMYKMKNINKEPSK